ncbi:hypothetical protein ACFL1L_04275 [Thermoplasmatota archaeon]
MKTKIITFLVMMLLIATTITAITTIGLGPEEPSTGLATDIDRSPIVPEPRILLSNGGKDFYAYVAYDSSMEPLPLGPCTFPSTNPGVITSLAPTSSTYFLSGGTWADGVWYGCEFYDNIWTIDETTGAMSVVGSYDPGATGLSFNGLAYDPTTNTMYGCSSEDLYTVDMVTGASTLVGSFGISGGIMIGIAFDSSGNLYGTDIVSDSLYAIDPSTGTATLVGTLGIYINFAQDMSFDLDTGILYLAACDGFGALYTCDTTTGAATFVGDFENYAEITCLAIPYEDYKMEVTKEIIDAEYYYDISPYFTPVPIFTNAWWDIAINVESGSEALDDILVNDGLGAKLDLVVQEEEYVSDTYEETDIITDATGMDTHGQADFCFTHYFDPADIGSATLTIRAYDIDDYDPWYEHVEITADGDSLGYLENTGQDSWGETEFVITDLTDLEDGQLEVCVYFDQRTNYFATIDWSELTIEYNEYDYYDYIFKLDGTPIPLVDDDDQYKGDDGDYVEWWQANKKYDPIKKPCATLLEWTIDSLDAHETTTLEFRVETIQFEVGPKKAPQMKQSFTSTCHHSLNDGAVAVVEFDGEYYDFMSNPIEVSVFDPEPGADSDGDGLEDWDEVEIYITDPCCMDTDGDGFNDGYEIDHGSDPTDPDCYPPSFIQADLIYSEGGLCSCDYEICLTDDFGDGWNGGMIDVIVDSVIVYDDLTLASGTGPECYSFTVIDGSTIEIDYTAGTWAYENNYIIYDSEGNLVTYQGFGGTDPGDWSGTATCPCDGGLLVWNYAVDYNYPDYEVRLDGVTEWYYLDLWDYDVEVYGGPLTTDYHTFYLDPTSVPDDFYTYWTGRGVYDGCTAVQGWEPTMWEIIRDDGPTLPMFYIKYDGIGGYMLVDGLQYALGQGDNPLRVNGDYPTGLYTFNGVITNTCGAWEDVEITIDFSPVPELLSVGFGGYDPTFGDDVGDVLWLTFSDDIFMEGTAQKLYFQTAAPFLTKATWTYVDNVLTISIDDASQIFTNPRPDVGDYVTGIEGIVDACGNPVIVPPGGVEIVD